jgi:hypothetical protein
MAGKSATRAITPIGRSVYYPATIVAEDFHFLSSQQKMKKAKLSALSAPLR